MQAIQIEQGQTTPDGVLGPTTLSLLTTIQTGSTLTPFVLLLQFSLYVNGYSPNGFDGKYGAGAKKAVTDFRSFVKLTADGIAGKQTWALLLVVMVEI